MALAVAGAVTGPVTGEMGDFADDGDEEKEEEEQEDGAAALTRPSVLARRGSSSSGGAGGKRGDAPVRRKSAVVEADKKTPRRQAQSILGGVFARKRAASYDLEVEEEVGLMMASEEEGAATELILSLKRCERELRDTLALVPVEIREATRSTADELGRLSTVAIYLRDDNLVARAARRAAAARRRVHAVLSRTRKATTRVMGAGLQRLPVRRERSYKAVLTDDEGIVNIPSDDDDDDDNDVPPPLKNGPPPTTTTQRVSWGRDHHAPSSSLVGALHPNSGFKRRWDFLTSVFALVFVFGADARNFLVRSYYATNVGWGRAPAPGSVWWWWWWWLVDSQNILTKIGMQLLNVWFLVDVGLNFVTGYVDKDGVLIMSKSRIAKHYLSTYFFFDLWCALPVERFVLPPQMLLTIPLNECAKGSIETPLMSCRMRRGPLTRVRNLWRRARVIVPRSLAWASRHGRLRQVLVSTPGLTTAAIRIGRLLRATRVLSVKWRSFAVLCRRSLMTARLKSRATFSPKSRALRRRISSFESLKKLEALNETPAPSNNRFNGLRRRLRFWEPSQRQQRSRAATRLANPSPVVRSRSASCDAAPMPLPLPSEEEERRATFTRPTTSSADAACSPMRGDDNAAPCSPRGEDEDDGQNYHRLQARYLNDDLNDAACSPSLNNVPY